MEPVVLATWGLVAATVTGAAFVAIAWTWIIRHNQRSALDRVDVLVRFLESIVVSSETPPAERLGGRGSRNSAPSGRRPA